MRDTDSKNKPVISILNLNEAILNANALQKRWQKDEFNINADQINSDSRYIQKDQIFIPLSGENFDGHDYINSAFEKGARFSFCNPRCTEKVAAPWHDRLLHVESPLEAMLLLARIHLKSLPNIKVVAITGSVGKTTVKDIVTAGLGYKAFGSKANRNNEIGVSQNIFQLTTMHQWVILEFGARNPDDIKILTDMFEPDISILTNVGHSHFERFGSYERLLHTKLDIFRRQEASCLHILPVDLIDAYDKRWPNGKALASRLSFDPAVNEMASDHPSAHPIAHHSDLRITSDSFTIDQTATPALQRKIGYALGSQHYCLSLAIYHRAAGVAAAPLVALMHKYGIDQEFVNQNLAELTITPGRFSLYAKNGRWLINDSYNASFESYREGLASLERIASNTPQSLGLSSTRVLIFCGDVLELGNIAEKVHRDIAGLFNKLEIDYDVICIGPNAKIIYENIQNRNHTRSKKYYASIDMVPSWEEILKHYEPGIVYFKASKGIKLSQYANSIIGDRQFE